MVCFVTYGFHPLLSSLCSSKSAQSAHIKVFHPTSIFLYKHRKIHANPYTAISMPSSFTKVESAAGMQDNFNEDEPSRGSNEFLIDHELKLRKGKTQRKSLFWTFSIILSAIGVIELIASATILLQLRSLHQPQIGSERNHLIPRCLSSVSLMQSKLLIVNTVPTHQVLFQKDGSATTKSLSQEDRNETRENWLTYMPSKSQSQR